MMQPQLASIVEQFEGAERRLHRLADSLPHELWNQRRDPARWSVAECVAHLNLTSRAYVPLLQDALEEARALGGPPVAHYRMDLAGRLIAALAGPLPRIGPFAFGRSKTTAAFVPSGELPRAELLAEFTRLQGELIDLARAGNRLPLDRVKIASPFNERLRYNAYAALVILPRHEERHLWQAERVWNETPNT